MLHAVFDNSSSPLTVKHTMEEVTNVIHEQPAARVRGAPLSACAPQQTPITDEKVRFDRVQRPFLRCGGSPLGIPGRIEFKKRHEAALQTGRPDYFFFFFFFKNRT